MDAADKHLHAVVLAHIAEVRKRLSEANIGPTFSVAITVSGRLNSEDGLKVAYSVTKEWGANATEGNALTPVVDEFLRRLGWNARYAPLALAAPEEAVEPPPVQPPSASG